MAPQSLSSSLRIEIIDILRGFTLFGIIIIHMTEQYYAGVFPEGVGSHTTADVIIQGLTAFLIRGKFFMIFSFLFGLSFHLQFSKTDSGFVSRFAWRLFLLGIIGVIHHMHYGGDILTIYAMLGFLLIVLNPLPNKALLITGILLSLNVPTLLLRIYGVITGFGLNDLFNTDQPLLMEHFEIVKHGTYFEILQANLFDFKSKMIFQIWSGRLCVTLGLFLLGIYAGRNAFFRNIDVHISSLKKAIKYGMLGTIACVLAGSIFFIVPLVLRSYPSQGVVNLVNGTLFDFQCASLSVFYVAGIILLSRNTSRRNVLNYFAPVGRMGLTIYLMQSLFGALIFFSYGLGLIGELSADIHVLLAVALFAFQIMFANLWFKYFQYGPVEWLWRSLTYMKMQPFVKHTPVVGPGGAPFSVQGSQEMR